MVTAGLPFDVVGFGGVIREVLLGLERLSAQAALVARVVVVCHVSASGSEGP